MPERKDRQSEHDWQTLEDEPMEHVSQGFYSSTGEHHTGQLARQDGTFQCMSCGTEITVQQGQTFPICPSCDAARGWEWSQEKAA